MGEVRNQTQSALREFVYEDRDENQLKQRSRRVKRENTGGIPQNIRMATFDFVEGTRTD